MGWGYMVEAKLEHFCKGTEDVAEKWRHVKLNFNNDDDLDWKHSDLKSTLDSLLGCMSKKGCLSSDKMYYIKSFKNGIDYSLDSVGFEMSMIKKHNPFWIFNKHLKSRMSYLKGINEDLINSHAKLSRAYSKLHAYWRSELHQRYDRYKQLLSQLGFVCKTVTRMDDSKIAEVIEVYESTCSDEKLLNRAQKMHDFISKNYDQSKEEINKQYGDIGIIDSLDSKDLFADEKNFRYFDDQEYSQEQDERIM